MKAHYSCISWKILPLTRGRSDQSRLPRVSGVMLNAVDPVNAHELEDIQNRSTKFSSQLPTLTPKLQKPNSLFRFSSTLITVIAETQRMNYKHYSAAAAAALSVLTLGSATNANALALKFYNSGVIKYRQGDYIGAISDFDKALQIDPQDLEAIENRGAAKHQLGDYKGAIDDSDKALQINPQLATSYSNRGVSKYELKDYQGAIADFNKALEINPLYPNVFLSRGNVKKRLGDYQGAMSDYSKAIEIEPLYSDAYENRGILKKDMRDYKGSISDYNKALEINPQSASVYSNRGISNYLESGDADSACADFKKSASLGLQYRINWLKSEEGKWCRDMRGAKPATRSD